MIYTHVLNRGGLGLRSPFDRVFGVGKEAGSREGGNGRGVGAGVGAWPLGWRCYADLDGKV
jgi:hypothetical protein